ncbi:AAA family ATPase [Paenisporosarcina cavernae]|uniref:ATP-binding protein n=1 Tax=Paenisporosarcina cavernae TaxID=2320858 RepID=A0A385YXA7_9BACL|nr:ATP-binding protein [Paenisporosarcina cavernae]AYC30142.1 ATP-binding protein [Paenisporosarcina cavernae]
MFEQFDFEQLFQLQRETKPIVVMMCGVAGSGKTTFAKILEKKGFVRLSIDEEIWTTNGRWGIDFPMEKLVEYRASAEGKLRLQLIQLMKDKQHVVIDFSFWDRSRREDYKRLIESSGGKWVLLYLQVEVEELQKRLQLRNQRADANSFPISDELLASYLKRFEVPKGEGEIVVRN